MRGHERFEKSQISYSQAIMLRDKRRPLSGAASGGRQDHRWAGSGGDGRGIRDSRHEGSGDHIGYRRVAMIHEGNTTTRLGR